ncbi:MAG: MATE family efflux transporter [Mitsuokella sp.]|uniref:MATE family efflux transporter n=1 Tax=Mitsuokella sp. TaxID=2049034 RepID=UPI003F0ECDA2
MNENADNFLEGPLAGKIFRFALPVAFTIICEQLVSGTDVLILGRFVGPSAMAAVGNDTPVLTLLISLLVGLSLGANVLLAQAIGGRKEKEANKILHTSVLFALLLGLAFAVIGEIVTTPLLALLNVPPEVQNEAEVYLRIFFCSMPFLSLYNFEAALFRAMGDSRTPLYALILAAVLNAVLDLLTASLGFGLAGIVWVTVLAYVLDAVVLFILLVRHPGLHLSLRHMTFASSELKEIVRIGLPAGVQGMVFSVSNLVIQSAINSLGPEAMAASSAAFAIEINIYAFVNGFGQAATTFVGQNFGALKIRRCFDVTKKTLQVETIFVFAVSMATVLAAHPLIALFAKDPLVISYGVMRIYMVTGVQIINGVIEILSGSLRGYGYSLPPALVVLFTVCGVRIIWVLTIFAAAPSFTMLLTCYPLSWLATALLLAIVYRRLRQNIIKNYATRLREEMDLARA